MKSIIKHVPLNVLRNATDNYRSQYNYGNVQKLGLGIKETGPAMMQPLRATVNKVDKSLLDVFSGNRRLAGILSLPADETKDWLIPVQVFSELSEVDRITLMKLDNEHQTCNQWEDAIPVERLTKLGLKQADVARKLDMDEVDVTNCKVLYQAPPLIREAGEQGRIAATTYIQRVRDAKKHKKLDEFHAQLLKSLEDSNYTLTDGEQVEVKRVKFDFPSYEQLETERQEKISFDKAHKQYNDCYTAVETAIKSLPAELQSQFKERFLKLIVPTDETNEVYKGKSRVERVNMAKEFLQAILADIKTAKESFDKAQADAAELAKTHAQQNAGAAELAKLNADAPKQDAPPSNQDAPKQDAPPSNQDAPKQDAPDSNAAAKGQGETEASRRRARVQALVGMIAAASDVQSLTRDAKSRLGDAVKRLQDINKWSLELTGLTE